MRLIDADELLNKVQIMLMDIGCWNEERVEQIIGEMPSVEPDTWMERNRERILEAGMEGREVEFRIGGRLFAIREKAQ